MWSVLCYSGVFVVGGDRDVKFFGVLFGFFFLQRHKMHIGIEYDI